MENLSDVEVEDIGDEPFEFDGRPYVFEPEYTDEELLAPENVRAERERRRERNRQWRLHGRGHRRPGGTLEDVVCKWIQKRKAYAAMKLHVEIN